MAVLLRSFKVHLSDTPIYWNIAGVAYPTISPEAKGHALPIRLEPLNLQS
jgi:hypothetical protein